MAPVSEWGQVDILSSNLMLEAGKMDKLKDLSEYAKDPIVKYRWLGQSMFKTAALVPGLGWSMSVKCESPIKEQCWISDRVMGNQGPF